MVRGSYGKSFKAPALQQIHLPTITYPNSPIVDPLSGALTPVNVVFGGNPDLEPAAGVSKTLGLFYANPASSALQASISYWRISEENSVQILGAQQIVDFSELFPGHVIRANGSGSPITTVFSNYVNFGGLQVAGLDYDLEYRFKLGSATLVPSLSATQTSHYRLALVPGAAPTDRDSLANDDGNWAPRWKINTALEWLQGPFALHLAGRYVGKYRDYDALPSGEFRDLGNYWLIDSNLRWSAGKHEGWLNGAYVELGAVNLFNRAPQFSNYQFGIVGYDPAQYDLRGRVVYLRAGLDL
jgi:outer membrane receptor protein involved in Fe transport